MIIIMNMQISIMNMQISIRHYGKFYYSPTEGRIPNSYVFKLTIIREIMNLLKISTGFNGRSVFLYTDPLTQKPPPPPTQKVTLHVGMD